MPIAQKVRIWQEVNNLRYFVGTQSTDLTLEQKTALVAALENKQEMKISTVYKPLKLPKETEFNFNSTRVFKGNETSFKIAKVFKEFKLDWNAFSLEEQNAIMQALLAYDGSDSGYATLCEVNESSWQFEDALLEKLSSINFPSGTANLSVLAMEKILPYLEEGKLFYEAATEVYGGHTHLRDQTGEVLSHLPYYGEVLPKVTAPIRKTFKAERRPESVEERYGKIPNPTVHVALNQLRHIVNALILRFGNPYEIHLELARDLTNNKKDKLKIHKQNLENEKDNVRRKKELLACGIDNPSRDDLLKMRLWEELAESGGLGRIDVYTGKIISLQQCMSAEIEIEHILPFSQTYDNTMANKSITFRSVNREKGNNTPYDYAIRKGGQALANEIIERAERLRKSKKWRFSGNAMEIYGQAAIGSLKKSALAEYFEHAERWSETPDPFLRTAQDPATTAAPQLKNQKS